MTESIVTAAAAVAALVAAGGAFYRWGKVAEAVSGLQKSDDRLQASIDQVREDVRELCLILLNQPRND
jgi:outer membrane murein-binding lipoprotein Lpp